MSNHKKEISDFNLDVYNALKGFPQNDNHAYLYMQVSRDNDLFDTMFCMAGTPLAVINGLICFMGEDDTYAEVVLSACANYLKQKENSRLRTDFAKDLLSGK